MPYNVNRPPKDLVKKVKKRHPKAGKKEIRQFIQVFNSSEKDGNDEATNFSIAWGVLNRNRKLKSSHRKTDPKKTKKLNKSSQDYLKLMVLAHAMRKLSQEKAAYFVRKAAGQVFLPARKASDLDPEAEESRYLGELKDYEEDQAWEQYREQELTNSFDKTRRMTEDEGWDYDSYVVAHADLIHMIKKIMSNPDYHNFDDEGIAEFLQENADPKEVKRLESFIQTSPSYLGSGAFGSAFEVGGGKIIKIFQNSSFYLDVKDKYKGSGILSTKAPGSISELNVMDKGLLTSDLGWAVMEELYPADKLPRNAKNAVSKLISPIWSHAKHHVFAIKRMFPNLTKENAAKELAKPEVAKLLQQSMLKLKRIVFQYHVDELHAINSELENSNLNLLRSGWIDELIRTLMIRIIYDENDIKIDNLGIRPYDERFEGTPLEKGTGIFVFFDA